MHFPKKIIEDIELHSVEGIIECFRNGVNPNDFYNGLPLIYELTSEYTRTPRFKDCVKAFVDHGLLFEDKILLAALLDDAGLLEQHLQADRDSIHKKYSLRCAYTPLRGVSLLHICAEYNHVSCAKVLVKYGAGINARAEPDKNGFGGHTPIFHTVNQNANNSKEMMDFLLVQGADLRITITGLIWGEGYEWETFIPAVNPISYAMMGLLPQMHRDEATVAEIVSRLLKEGYGIEYKLENVPNKYLMG